MRARIAKILIVLLAAAPLAAIGCSGGSRGQLDLARSARARGDYPAAIRIYADVLERSPRRQEAAAELAEVKTEYAQQVLRRASQVVSDEAIATAPELRQALETIESAQGLDPNGPLLGAARADYAAALAEIEQANRNRVQRIRDALASGEFDAARRALAELTRSDPAHPELAPLTERYRQRRASALRAVVERRLQDNDIAGARAVLETWERAGLSVEGRRNLERQINRREARWLADNIDTWMAENAYYTAYLAIIRSPQRSEFDGMLERIRSKGASFYLDQARRREARGEHGRAYLEAVKGFELDADVAGLFETHRDTRDVVLERIQQHIAIPTFGAPHDSPDAGAQFSDALISYLFRILPYGINIAEREKIDLLMREHEREFDAVGTISNVDLIVTGNVSLLEIDRQESEQHGTVRAEIGHTTKVNPAYEAYLRNRERGGRRSDEPAPPRTIKEPVYETIRYNKGKVTIKGFATVAVRIFDTEEGRITYAQEFNASYEDSDEYQDAVQAAGIEGDPLDLPTETEVKEKLRNSIVQQLAAVVQTEFEKRERDFLETAQYHVDRREYGKAVDELAQGFLFCVKADVPPNDPDYRELRRLIVELTERGFLKPES